MKAATCLCLILLSGCATAPRGSVDALRDGLEPYIRAHADALAVDGGPLSQATGVRLLRAIDAGVRNDRP